MPRTKTPTATPRFDLEAPSQFMLRVYLTGDLCAYLEALATRARNTKMPEATISAIARKSIERGLRAVEAEIAAQERERARPRPAEASYEGDLDVALDALKE